MRPRILLINPPIYDFAAYDFWLKPYGLLSVAGYLRGQAEFELFDFMDRASPLLPKPEKALRADRWGRGEFHAQELEKPPLFEHVPRYYRRFGVPRDRFAEFLRAQARFDFALVQTSMTYWYPGVREVIADLRAAMPQTRIVLGGVYASICPEHARTLGADLVVAGTRLETLWEFMSLAPDPDALPLWELYPRLSTAALKLADGCPFRCTYCSVPQIYAGFSPRPLKRVLAEYDLLRALGVKQIAFYDDALGFQPERVLLPFLNEVLARGADINLHTPNAMHARYITPEVARTMVRAGFKIVYLGFESSAGAWQRSTGGKVYAHELALAVENLRAAGADPANLHAYLIMAHPQHEQQELEASMRLASSLGLHIMLAEFSPIPGTPDGEACRAWTDIDEPLNHSKTAFPFMRLGTDEVRRLKTLCRDLNATMLNAER